jgi:pimeloyl-ACP methyl ester carboxylesterase
MAVSPARAATASAIAHSDVLSDDGTRLRAWTNDPDGVIEGPTVLLCNGLGTSPYAWPALLRPGCDVRVISWNHRGTGGSDRPRDPDRVGVEEHVEDALSVLDHFDVDRAVLMGWSIGVNTMFELAVRHPERALALFAVAGVPGDTFSSMLGPLRLPRLAARALTVSLSRGLSLVGGALTPLTTRLPIGPRAIDLLTRTGLMFPLPDPELGALAVSEFLTTPVDWYAHLALRSSHHTRVPLSGITLPTVFVAGTFDLMAGARDMATAAARIEGATYVELRGSHFLQMEQPDRVHALLLELVGRVT